MRVLVTGHRGYIGTVMTRMLLEAGHEVVGSTAIFTALHLSSWGQIDDVPTSSWMCATQASTSGLDAVVHLAALSNDPLEADHEITYSINHHASVRLANVAEEAGVKRFLLASSCSNYGRPATTSLTRPAAQPRDRLREVESFGRARDHATGGRQLLPDLSASGHGLRSIAADALRHRPEQPRCVGGHDGPDLLEIGRYRLGGRSCTSRTYRARSLAPSRHRGEVFNQAFNVGSTGQNSAFARLRGRR